MYLLFFLNLYPLSQIRLEQNDHVEACGNSTSLHFATTFKCMPASSLTIVVSKGHPSINSSSKYAFKESLVSFIDFDIDIDSFSTKLKDDMNIIE